MSKEKISHIRAKGTGGKLKFECCNCGATAEYDLPVSVDALDRFGKAFENNHKNCKVIKGRKLGKSK